jgi:hypothetical protein
MSKTDPKTSDVCTLEWDNAPDRCADLNTALSVPRVRPVVRFWLRARRCVTLKRIGVSTTQHQNRDQGGTAGTATRGRSTCSAVSYGPVRSA